MKKYISSISLYLLIFFFIIVAIVIQKNTAGITQTVETYTYDNLVTDIKSGNASALKVQLDKDGFDAATVEVTLSDNTKRTLIVVDVDGFMQIVNESIDKYDMKTNVLEIPKTSWLVAILPSLIVMVVAILLLVFIMQQTQGGGGGKVMTFGKSRAKVTIDEKNRVTFGNVAGLDEEKEELKEVVEFLKAPKKYEALGAKIPKGVLLVGPPGTGKTLLAKAVAGEAGVPFFSISGSDFVEMFVGVGASRVRDLFEQAKKNSPCIIFIDEIDAVGRKRGAGLGGGHDEREQTLNQLLVEMDGFGANEGVIVVAATNRHDILDPALLRPGRFDRHVVVGRPDVKGREEILNVHSKNKPMAHDVDLKVVAQTTSGFTGADLENLLNEAALLAARDNKKQIDMEEIRKAFVKVGIGTEKKSRVISEKEKRVTAYHEAGHAILHEMLEELDTVHSISIIPTGMAGGYTMPLPGEDRMYLSKKYMEQEIIALLGGRAAEFIIIGDITTGASNDIERATAMARNMVTKYGMSDLLGPIQFGDDNDEVFLGKDLAHTRNYGEEVAGTIDKEIRRIVESAYEEAKRLLNEQIEVLHLSAKALMEKEKITGQEFRSLFPDKSVLKHLSEEESELMEKTAEVNIAPEEKISEGIDEKEETK